MILKLPINSGNSKEVALLEHAQTPSIVLYIHKQKSDSTFPHPQVFSKQHLNNFDFYLIQKKIIF